MGRRRCVTLHVVLLMHSTRAAIAVGSAPGVKQTVAAFSESAIAKPYSQSPAPVAKNNSADILAHQRNFHKLKVVKELIITLFIVLSHVHLKLCRSHYFNYAAPSAVADSGVGQGWKDANFCFHRSW